MAKKYIQVGGDGCPDNQITGTVVGLPPPRDIWPEGRTYVEWTEPSDPPSEGTYDVETQTFTPPTPSTPVTTLSKADVIGALTPAQWREMQMFGADAAGAASCGVAYNDQDVCQAIDIFKSEPSWRLDDPRLARVFGMLVRKGVLSAKDVTALQAALAAAAR